MATVRNDRMIDRPVADVWARIADVGQIAAWFPSFVSSRLDPDGHRRIRLATGLELDEEIIAVDAELRRLQYRIVGGMPIVRSHEATVEVLDRDGGALVVYSTDVEPPALAWILGGVIEEGLAELDRQLTASER